MADLDSFPEGWTIQVKVRKQGRKDKYYVDPARAYIFNSRRDALRYSQTGELGKYAKSKDKDITEGEMENDKASSPVVKGQILADSSTKTGVSQNQDSIHKEAVQNEKTCEPTYTEKSSKIENLPFVQCKQASATSCPSQSEVGTLKQSGQKGETPMPKSVTGPLAEKILPDSSGVSKSKRVKLTDLPRRTSKRLAGIQIDQPLEIKTKNKARPSLASHLEEVKVNLASNVGELVKKTETDITEQMQLDPKKHTNSFRPDSHLPVMISQTEETGCNLTGTVEESAGNIETKDTTKKHKKREELEDNIMKQSKQKPTDLPLRVSKRLDGISIGPQLEHRTSTRPRSISVESPNESKGCSAEKIRSSSEVQESSTVVVTAETNLFIPPEADKTVEETRLPMEALLKEIWMDPCFEFAIKTLTGVIPIEDHHLKVDKIPQSSKNPPFSKCAWEEDPCFEFAVKTLTGDIGIEDYPRELQMRIGGDRDSLLPTVQSDSLSPPPPDSTMLHHHRNGALQGQLNNKRKKLT